MAATLDVAGMWRSIQAGYEQSVHKNGGEENKGRGSLASYNAASCVCAYFDLLVFLPSLLFVCMCTCMLLFLELHVAKIAVRNLKLMHQK